MRVDLWNPDIWKPSNLWDFYSTKAQTLGPGHNFELLLVSMFSYSSTSAPSTASLAIPTFDCSEAGAAPRGHLCVTWGVYLCAGKPPLADIMLSHPPDLTSCDSVIGLAITAMSGHSQYRGAAGSDIYIKISGINRVFLSYCFCNFLSYPF